MKDQKAIEDKLIELRDALQCKDKYTINNTGMHPPLSEAIELSCLIKALEWVLSNRKKSL